MKLCHTITITTSYAVTHAVRPCAQLAESNILRAPVHTSFSTHAFAAIADHEITLPVSALRADVRWRLQLTIVDEMEQKPLLLDVKPSQALFVLGEIVDGIAEALTALDFVFCELMPVNDSPKLCVEFIAPKDRPIRELIGSALCLNVMLDALLCSRGLLIGEVAATYANANSGESDVDSLLKQIWERSCFLKARLV